MLTDSEDALINAIEKLFPYVHHSLCTWHINKNILVYCLQYFKKRADFDVFQSCWNTVMYSKTETEFESNWDSFKYQYASYYPECVEYLQKQWIQRKYKVISCYVDKHMNFGTRTTSRVESNHWAHKREGNLFRCDLFGVYNVMYQTLEQQYVELNLAVQTEKTKV
jgi:hypothetical protein